MDGPLQPLLKQYWSARGHLSIAKGLLLYDNKLVIPSSMRLEVLNQIHQGHLGITKCRARAHSGVWWPGISTIIEEMVAKCPVCAKAPLIPTNWPKRPWTKLAQDLFEFKNNTIFFSWITFHAGLKCCISVILKHVLSKQE